MTESNTDTEAIDDRLPIRRTFDAPRERVWRAFTDDQPASAGGRST